MKGKSQSDTDPQGTEKRWFHCGKATLSMLLPERSPTSKTQATVANSKQDIEAETRRKVQEPGLAPPWTRHLLCGGLTIAVPMLFNPLLFLFALQEEAARILAQQPVSVGTCAALKPPRCSECVREAAWTSSVLPLAFSLLGISTF